MISPKIRIIEAIHTLWGYTRSGVILPLPPFSLSTKIDAGRVTAWVSRLYSSKASKYHLDDLRVYYRRENEGRHYDSSIAMSWNPTLPLEVERTAMSMAMLLGKDPSISDGTARASIRGDEEGKGSFGV